jgi:hypothetical protein
MKIPESLNSGMMESSELICKLVYRWLWPSPELPDEVDQRKRNKDASCDGHNVSAGDEKVEPAQILLSE